MGPLRINWPYQLLELPSLRPVWTRACWAKASGESVTDRGYRLTLAPTLITPDADQSPCPQTSQSM